MVDVSVIINLHTEGTVCGGTLDSVLEALRKASDCGISCEIICVVDNGNRETLEFIRRYNQAVEVFECHFGDLSESRNFGISLSKGRFITFIDGDDLWGNEWVCQCMRIMRDKRDEGLIIHPQLNLYFGKGTDSSFWVHPDFGVGEVDLLDLFISNRWTASCFAHRNVFRSVPYVKNQIDRGYGYEDWLWNLETSVKGYNHVTAEKTCHFIRRKSTNSLSSATISNNSIPDIGSMKRIGALRNKIAELLSRDGTDF